MIEIQSKGTAVLYNTRENKFGRIVLRMETRVDPLGYVAIIYDQVEQELETEDQNGQPVVALLMTVIGSKTMVISKEEINALFGAVNQAVPSSIPYYEREQELMRQAFLHYVTTDFVRDANGQQVQGRTIYGLSPSDWEIRRA